MSEEFDEIGDEGHEIEVDAAQAPRDRAALFVSQVRLAVSMGLAPIVGEATDTLRELHLLARVPLPAEFTADQWVLGVLSRELFEIRAKALWPHPIGTVVLVNNDGRTFSSRTTSTAQALPSGDVLVQVENMVGSVRVEDLSLK